MTYGSVCSGIEAATVAWDPLGWRPAFFAEIDKFPSRVLAHHYPEVTNAGDFTTIRAGQFEPIDLLVGGTPCQDFSIAGLRAGVAGERGNLTLEFLRLLDRLRPRWMVWENVPGVLSSTSHRAPDPCPPPMPVGLEPENEEVVLEDEYDSVELHALNCFVAGLSELGYGWAMRVLDAQYFGVPQRRRRVFVVGHLGDWRRAAAVLFERHSLSGYPAPRREKGKGATYDVAPCLGASGRGFERTGDTRGQDCLVAFGGNNCAGPIDVATAVNACGTASGRMDFESETFVAVGGFPDTVGPLMTHSTPNGHGCAGVNHGAYAGDVSPTLRSMGHAGSHANAGVMPAVAMNLRGREGGAMPELDDVASLRAASGGSSRSYVCGVSANQRGEVRERPVHGSLNGSKSGKQFDGIMHGMAVRRLTPRECERLQGFPDDYTKIDAKTADGPRYKALGNSMAVPCMYWLGRRIQEVEDLCRER